MDSGQITLPELLQRLEQFGSIEVRMALRRIDNAWQVHTLVFEHLPSESLDEDDILDYDYERVRLIIGAIDGKTAASWLSTRDGQVHSPVAGGAACSFTLPAIADSANWHRYPSHSSNDYRSLPQPYTHYTDIRSWSNEPWYDDAFLLADGLPFFPNFKTAVLQLIHKVSDLSQYLSGPSLDPQVTVRITNTEAWLHHVTLSPTAIKVTVSGTRVVGVQVTISGSSGVQFQQQLHRRGSVECPLPNGVPSPLWIVLSRGNQWLDFYHRDERWPVTNLRQSNVTVEAGDPGAELEALIAQGEGLTTEFKASVPNDRDQMLKTIAAFANGSGGVLLLGIKDKTGELVGFTGNPDDITQMIRNTVFPDPDPHIRVAEVEKRRILAIYVKKGTSPPYGLHPTNTHYYVRRGATTFPARPEELRAIVVASQHTAHGPFAPYIQ